MLKFPASTKRNSTRSPSRQGKAARFQRRSPARRSIWKSNWYRRDFTGCSHRPVAGPAAALLLKLGKTAHRAVATTEGVLITISSAHRAKDFSNHHFANSYRYSTKDITAPSNPWIFGFADSMR